MDDMKCQTARRARPLRVCKRCGKTFKPKAVDRITYCSRECSFEDKRRPLPEKKYTRSCSECNSEFKTNREAQKTCSKECNAARNRRRSRSLPDTVSFICRGCGKRHEETLGSLPRPGMRRSKYCSRRCYRKAMRKAENVQRRLAMRTRNQAVACGEKFLPTDIFHRDGWICQICGKKVDREARAPHPKSPVLDHILPLSKGGEHTRKNVQLAHFMCNSHKRDLLGSQMLLFG